METKKTSRRLMPSLRTSIYGLLGHSFASESMLDHGLEEIRESMLELLGENGWRQFPQVTRRVRYANDVQGLWYLRGDLMAALASLHGEAQARTRVEVISGMFRGLLPGGLSSRPSPLVG